MDSTSKMLRETATRLFQAHTEPKVLREAEQGVWPAAAWAAVEEAGLHLALVPEEAGGFGVAVPDALSLVRVAGEHALPLPLPETMIATWLLAGAGLEIPSGPLTVAPVDPRDALSVTRIGSGFRIEGTARRVPWGRTEQVGVVVLADAGGTPYVALVPRAAITVAEPGENLAREPRDLLRFEGTVPVDAIRPAASGVGVEQLRALGAAMRSLQLAGGLMRIADMGVQYAQERVQFGRPIGKFQTIQHNLAIVATQAAAAVAASDLAAEAVGDGMRLFPIAAAKARAGEAASLSAGIVHQVHGAIGFTYEHSLHFLTKRLWSWRDEFGSEAVWNAYVGRHVAKAGADRVWAEITGD